MSVVSSLQSSRVSRFATLVLVFSLAGAAVGATNDLDVARQALRDGFWSLARTRAYACASTSDEAKQVVLESWACEAKWADVLNALAAFGNPSGDVYAYYRILALAKSGDERGLARALAEGAPKNPPFARLTARLIADLALQRGDPARAVKAFEGVTDLSADDRLLLAEAQRQRGEFKEAETLWREVLADTNASVRAAATAAVNAGDEMRLRNLASNAVPTDVRALAALRLGTLLIRREGSFAEGARLIRETAVATPDAEGALEAARALAAIRLARGDWQDAVVAYGEILQIWPAAAAVESVQEGLGWALLKTGRPEEALQAFQCAESCAKTEDERALAAVKTSDALMALGRTEDAMAKCRDVLAKNAGSAIAGRLKEVVRLRELELKGRRLYREFRFAEAQKVFAEVAAGDEVRRGRMVFFEVLCLYGQGRDGEAEKRARELAAKTEDPLLKADVTRWLARLTYNAGRWREAQELFVAHAASPRVSADDAADSRVWAARAALAANDFSTAIALASEVVKASPRMLSQAEALIVQGEALIELARFDEAVLVLERAALATDIPAKLRLEAQILRADALYALGADNPARYEEALNAYRAIGQSEVPDESRLAISYKIGLALEKLKRRSEAVDQYYTHVLLAYREMREKGCGLDDEARAVFARAAFRLADLCEAGGRFLQAQKTLELVVESDVPAAAEAQKRIDRLRMKGVLP